MTPSAHSGLTRVDHLDAMLDSNSDNLVASEISSDRGILTSFANDVGFVGLYTQGIQSAYLEGKTKQTIMGSLTLSVHAQSILITAIC